MDNVQQQSIQQQQQQQPHQQQATTNHNPYNRYVVWIRTFSYGAYHPVCLRSHCLVARLLVWLADWLTVIQFVCYKLNAVDIVEMQQKKTIMTKKTDDEAK